MQKTTKRKNTIHKMTKLCSEGSMLACYKDVKPIEADMSDSMQYKFRKKFQDGHVALFRTDGGAC